MPFYTSLVSATARLTIRLSHKQIGKGMSLQKGHPFFISCRTKDSQHAFVEKLIGRRVKHKDAKTQRRKVIGISNLILQKKTLVEKRHLNEINLISFLNLDVKAAIIQPARSPKCHFVDENDLQKIFLFSEKLRVNTLRNSVVKCFLQTFLTTECHKGNHRVTQSFFFQIIPPTMINRGSRTNLCLQQASFRMVT